MWHKNLHVEVQTGIVSSLQDATFGFLYIHTLEQKNNGLFLIS